MWHQCLILLIQKIRLYLKMTLLILRLKWTLSSVLTLVSFWQFSLSMRIVSYVRLWLIINKCVSSFFQNNSWKVHLCCILTLFIWSKIFVIYYESFDVLLCIFENWELISPRGCSITDLCHHLLRRMHCWYYKEIQYR